MVYGAANALAQSAMQLVTAPFWFGANAIRLLRDGIILSSSPSSTAGEVPPWRG
jgi:hypothetical protein